MYSTQSNQSTGASYISTPEHKTRHRSQTKGMNILQNIQIMIMIMLRIWVNNILYFVKYILRSYIVADP